MHKIPLKTGKSWVDKSSAKIRQQILEVSRKHKTTTWITDARTDGRTHGRTTRKHIASAGAYRRRRLKNTKLHNDNNALAALTMLFVGSWPKVDWLWQPAAWLYTAHNGIVSFVAGHLLHNNSNNQPVLQLSLCQTSHNMHIWAQHCAHMLCKKYLLI